MKLLRFVSTPSISKRLNSPVWSNRNKRSCFKVENRCCHFLFDPCVRLCDTMLHITVTLLFSCAVNNWPRGVCAGKWCGMATIILIGDTFLEPRKTSLPHAAWPAVLLCLDLVGCFCSCRNCNGESLSSWMYNPLSCSHSSMAGPVFFSALQMRDAVR